jgi:mono/diheme cytochrome c family protein
MRNRRSGSLPAVMALAALSSLPLTARADVQAGKAAAQAKCVQCHEADDWEGESTASLESLIRDIVAGKVKHKGALQLSAAEISDIAAYWGQSSQKGKKRN